MADEVKPIKWGRIRPWNGSKGCPPVAADKPCGLLVLGNWAGCRSPKFGSEWHWDQYHTAYRIPKQFDPLDDYGNRFDPFAGYTAAELRAALEAKEAAEFERLKPWEDLFWEAYRTPFREGAAARILRDGAAKLLGVTL